MLDCKAIQPDVYSTYKPLVIVNSELVEADLATRDTSI